MGRDFLSLGTDEMLDSVLSRIGTAEYCTTLPKIHRKKLAGHLVVENANHFVLIVFARGELHVNVVTFS
jgi:hypothetical protein